MAFREKTEKFGHNKNGNYMMALELISKFGPFLATHIAVRGNPGRGNMSYLSSTICDEFISLIASNVRKVVMAEMKDSKYYSMIVDSTPDCSHVDQLSLIIRYVPRKKYEAVERFIKFLPYVGHRATDMWDTVVVALTAYDVNFQDCRGQSYDNASNTSGLYAGYKL